MKIQSHVAIILGIGLALAVLSSISQQGVFATLAVTPDGDRAYVTNQGSGSVDVIANPSGSNATGGNMTGGNITGAEEGIPTANTTGEEPISYTSSDLPKPPIEPPPIE